MQRCVPDAVERDAALVEAKNTTSLLAAWHAHETSPIPLPERTANQRRYEQMVRRRLRELGLLHKPGTML